MMNGLKSAIREYLKFLGFLFAAMTIVLFAASTGILYIRFVVPFLWGK